MEGPGSVNNCEGVVSEAGAQVGFTEASDENAALRLCYQFGSDNYKLYKDFILYVAAVSSINVLEGDSAVAVVNVQNASFFMELGLANQPSTTKLNSSAKQMFKSQKTVKVLYPHCCQGTRMLSFLVRILSLSYFKESDRHFQWFYVTSLGPKLMY